MPYDSLRELPKGIRNVLPKAAQDIWRRSFNEGWNAAHKEGKRGKERDTQARQWGWQAVKAAGYVKDAETGKWKKSKTAKKGVQAAAKRSYPAPHKGRPGEVGGSLPRENGAPVKKKEEKKKEKKKVDLDGDGDSRLLPEGWESFRDWGGEWRERFSEEYGHTLGDSVSWQEGRKITQALTGMPRCDRPVTFEVVGDGSALEKAWEKDVGTKSKRARYAGGFYNHNTDRIFVRGDPYGGKDITRNAHEYAHFLDYNPATKRYRSSTSTKVKSLFAQAKQGRRLVSGGAKRDVREFIAESMRTYSYAFNRKQSKQWKKKYPESWDAIEEVLGDRMPEEWR